MVYNGIKVHLPVCTALMHCGCDGFSYTHFSGPRMLNKKDCLIYLKQKDKDRVYPTFASDSLASCNLYKQLNTHPNHACVYTRTYTHRPH